jgi:phage terminase large subunit GpA-like protein
MGCDANVHRRARASTENNGLNDESTSRIVPKPRVSAVFPLNIHSECIQIMDALSPSHPCQRVAFMKGSQVGATEAGGNWIGYVIHHAPGPMLAVQPSVELAKRFSQQRIDPLIEESPVSRIEREYEASDQRRFFVPCPHCGARQYLKFEWLCWEKGKPETATYVCEGCEQPIAEHHKTKMLAQGEWRRRRRPPIRSPLAFTCRASTARWAGCRGSGSPASGRPARRRTRRSAAS